MNNRRSTDFILILILLGIIFIGYALVNSIDRTRFELEKLHASIHELREKISVRPIVPAAADPSRKNSVSAESKLPFANAEFHDPKALPGGRFITAISSDTKNMNVLINNDSTASAVWEKAFDSLAQRNYRDLDRWEPKMAESWKVSEDGLRFRIKLRKGILWHDFTDPVTKKVWKNVPVSSHDFKFYVDVIKNPEVDAAPLRTYMKDLERIEIDERESKETAEEDLVPERGDREVEAEKAGRRKRREDKLRKRIARRDLRAAVPAFSAEKHPA